MPIYEYRCDACNKRTSIFVRSVSSPVRAACEHCGRKKLSRILSKVHVHGGGGRVNLDDPSSFDGVDESDPRAIARMMRQMGEESGDELGPEFGDMVDRMERGESPEDVFGDSALDDGGFGDEDE
jgi:putative FmdB family regulatory protein